MVIKIDENTIEQLLMNTGKQLGATHKRETVLVHGVGGKQIKAQTENQRKMVSKMQVYDMLL